MKQKLISKISNSIFMLYAVIIYLSCSNRIYQKSEVDKIAEFPFGQDSLNAFLKRNTKWVLNGASGQGYMLVGFTVNINGERKDIKIIKSMFFSPFEIEAIRLVKLMPNWIPAQKNNKTVCSKVELPIKFKLE